VEVVGAGGSVSCQGNSSNLGFVSRFGYRAAENEPEWGRLGPDGQERAVRESVGGQVVPRKSLMIKKNLNLARLPIPPRGHLPQRRAFGEAPARQQLRAIMRGSRSLARSFASDPKPMSSRPPSATSLFSSWLTLPSTRRGQTRANWVCARQQAGEENRGSMGERTADVTRREYSADMNATPSLNPSSPGNGGTVADWVAHARLGAPQTHRDIVIWPLFASGANGISYRTLDEAISSSQAQVTEVSESGSVPQLKVINQSPESLLILDGEELIGAKQNRVVNATLLLEARSETIIPVSCTEQGRWRHVSNAFRSSDVVMEMKVRRAKVRSVSDSLKAGSGHASDQGEVWDEIHALHAKAMHASPTNAMHDLFVERENDMRAALAAFPVEPGQHGLLVSIRGNVVGCDLLSRADAYGRLHGKLVRSYVLDALLEEPGVPKADEAQAREFLTSATTCREERFPSVGYGESVRLHNGQTAGAALIYEGTVIHVALFRFDADEATAAGSREMARLSQRRRRLRL
jgi:hypothetical protein